MRWRRNEPTEPTLNDELVQLWKAIRELKEKQVSTQADVDALTMQVDQVASDLTAASANLQTEIDNLAAANPNLDLDALQAAVAPLDAQVQTLGSLKPTPPASS